MLQSSLFSPKSKDLKATSQMKSGRIVVHDRVDFSNMRDNYETKSSKFAVETLQTAELSLKWRSCVYGSKRIFRLAFQVEL